MPQHFDVATLDAHLERLLELTLPERERSLSDIESTDPDLAAVLRKVLRIAGEAHTADFNRVGDALTIANDELPPPQIAGYRLTGEIGRGGMATVYSASRNVHGIEQTVAIKVLRAAILSSVDRERFLNEQRILARLQHPNIATLLDVGVVDERPYMVLEHIDGEPIDTRLQPTTDQLPAILDAIDQVIDALALAHQHFVIHRDIKPGNVLVDRQGRIKLIDFGIAKALDGAVGLGLDPTLTGNSPLTLRYASPEQLSAQPLGVGSDIFQLGLLLYRLVSGSWPYDESEQELPTERTRAHAVAVPPSSRVSDRGLKRALRGDLDSIVLRCLRFQPAERYRSVAELKDDLDRHRQNRPVLARRHTRGYVLRSFLARHRLGASLGLAAILLLAVTVVAALALAERSRDYAKRTERILDTVASMFASANPYAAKPGEVSVSEVVNSAAKRFLAEDDSDPLFQVLMLERLAELQRAIEDYSAEFELLERALELIESAGLDAETRSRVLLQLAESGFSRGDYADADRRLALGSALFSASDATKARYLQAKLQIERKQYAQAEILFSELFAELEKGSHSVLFQHTVLNSYGILQRRLGNTDAAIAAYRQSLQLLDPDELEHQEALSTVPVNIAIALGASGRFAESDEEFRQHLEVTSARLGEQHPQLATLARSYSTLMLRTSRYDSAYALLHRFEASAQAGDNMFQRASFLSAVAEAALYAGRDAEALSAATGAMNLALSIFGADTKALDLDISRLIWTLFELGEIERAARWASVLLSEVPEASPRNRTVLVIAAALGLDVEAPALIGEELSSDTCIGAERIALIARLVEHRAPPELTVPADCNGTQADRLVALGLSPRNEQSAPAFAVEAMRSPLARLAGGPPASWPTTPIDPQIGVQLDRLYEQLVAGKGQESDTDQ